MRYLFVGLLTAAAVTWAGWVALDNPVAEGWRDDLLPLPASAPRVGDEAGDVYYGSPGRKRRRKPRRRPPRTVPSSTPAPAPSPSPAPAGTTKATKPKTKATKVSPAQVHFELGLAYLHQKKVPAAVTELQKCIALDPKHALAYRALGMAHSALGKQTSAVAAFEKFVELAPNHRDAPKVRAIIEAHKGGN